MILEIRTYRLHHGRLDEFVTVMRDEALPLLEHAGIRIVRFGSSVCDEDDEDDEALDTAFLIRLFDSANDRTHREDEFYSSDAWRRGPREHVMSMIASFHTVAVELSAMSSSDDVVRFFAG